ncbi:phosphoribosylglycinamide formyltransferase [Clostridium thermobutyricum]|uniref:Phosphoribosylglycinamide formyltransferase n=1 Tax=Clostridium thermobutyricum TaxID=29372 RepID=N9WET7_9CLOT|nr:phosphoribosylglycinamide formyltransferase [Clostridium thermobutyricum]ENZ01566.1 phosphoribosylglycinamide formyltransferase [Clostridium thermobutyricum]
MFKIAVLASGRGTNLQAIIDKIKDGYINASIEIVIGSKEGIYALERAKKNNIKTSVVSKKEFGKETSNEILKLVENVDLIVLAGYLSILEGEILNKFKNRIINIHPSLIPAFCGDKMYGEYVHKAVIEKGVKYSGCTVHFVNEEVDGGAIILQDIVNVDFNDTYETLQKKVLVKEHIALPKAIKLISEDKIQIVENKVSIKEEVCI